MYTCIYYLQIRRSQGLLYKHRCYLVIESWGYKKKSLKRRADAPKAKIEADAKVANFYEHYK